MASREQPSSSIDVPFVAVPSKYMSRSYELKSLDSLCNAHMLYFSASSDFTLSTSKTWFLVFSLSGSSPGVFSGCVNPRIDLETSLAFFFKLVLFVWWRCSADAICFLGFVLGILTDLSLPMELSCVDLVATVGRSVSAIIASTGVVLICPVIALPAYL